MMSRSGPRARALLVVGPARLGRPRGSREPPDHWDTCWMGSHSLASSPTDTKRDLTAALLFPLAETPTRLQQVADDAIPISHLARHFSPGPSLCSQLVQGKQSPARLRRLVSAAAPEPKLQSSAETAPSRLLNGAVDI